MIRIIITIEETENQMNEHAVRKIIKDYEAAVLSPDKAIDEIARLTGKSVDGYFLENYWRSENLDDVVRRLCVNQVLDWNSIDDKKALELISEMRENICNEAIFGKNATALSKRYRKPEGKVRSIVGRIKSLNEVQVLAELKKDDVINL